MRRLIASNPDTVRRRLANGDRHSLRIAMPADTNPHATVQFDDAVFGHQEFNLAHDVGDTIVRRADGLFSYQLVVVVDDLDMGVDDIVRGRDLLRSNALQIAIRRALIKAGFRKAKTQASAPSQHAPQSQYTPYNPENPRYAHLPLIDNAAGRRLAKRERSLDMGALRAHGVTAEQVVGYCAWLLGLQGDSAHTSPQPMSAVEALQEFDWGKVRADTATAVSAKTISTRISACDNGWPGLAELPRRPGQSGKQQKAAENNGKQSTFSRSTAPSQADIR